MFYWLAFKNIAQTAFRNNSTGQTKELRQTDPASEKSPSHEYSGHSPETLSSVIRALFIGLI